ncbi:hypothetical protein GWK47_046498 [Chionoecetes opilio]|uniref:Uncharacterized protein n=1 Tax=Chionoecetes opilio TaxID=41210 RepID=A0A8J5CX59_CHIOP|nr:hypothetical protein GWK47_046498 [Chionoecetes opilio]
MPMSPIPYIAFALSTCHTPFSISRKLTSPITELVNSASASILHKPVTKFTQESIMSNQEKGASPGDVSGAGFKRGGVEKDTPTADLQSQTDKAGQGQGLVAELQRAGAKGEGIGGLPCGGGKDNSGGKK